MPYISTFYPMSSEFGSTAVQNKGHRLLFFFFDFGFFFLFGKVNKT